MGWSAGTEIARAVVRAVKANVPDDRVRHRIYVPFLKEMDDLDWDTQDEALGIDEVFDRLLEGEGVL